MNLDKLSIKNNITSDLVNKSLEELYYIYNKANSSYKRSILFGCGAVKLQLTNYNALFQKILYINYY